MNEQAQEKYQYLQQLQQQVQQLYQHNEHFKGQQKELLDAQQFLEEGSEKDLLTPIGGGIFIPSKTEAIKDVIVHVGSETAVKKSADEVKAHLIKQLTELDALTETTERHLKKAIAESEKVEKELQEML